MNGNSPADPGGDLHARAGAVGGGPVPGEGDCRRRGARRLRAFPELGLSQNKTLFSECKNDIGVARTCHKAPKGFQSAAEISGVILLGVAPRQQALQIEPLAVSRYHRLGGGDIDGAIVYEVLVPQLCEQNGLSALDLGFDDKKNYVGPAYLGLAETLKISLCTQISRLLRFNKYEGMDKTQIAAGPLP